MVLKYWWLCVCALVVSGWCRAQSNTVLMHVGGKPVDVAEYRYFCSKHVEESASLEQFINFKLKALAAEKNQLDTVPDIRLLLSSYCHGLLQQCLWNNGHADSLINEYSRLLQKRKYAGRALVSHIFKYIPQNVSAWRLHEIEAQMDSLYQLLKDGKLQFDECVNRFSEDKGTFWVTPLQMPVEFEEVVFNLPVGKVSNPFFTPQGIHIVKVLEYQKQLDSEKVRQGLEERLLNQPNSRLLLSSIDSLKQCYGYMPDKSGVEELLREGKSTNTLFTLNGKAYTGVDFALFARIYPASVRKQLDAFVAKSVLDCAYAHLRADGSDLRWELCFFRDSLLGSAIVHREIRNLVKTDSAGIAKYFKKHAKRYNWPEERYDGIVLHCKTKRMAKQVRKFLKKIPQEDWTEAIRLGVNTGGQVNVVAERGLFAPGDNAFVDSRIFKKDKPQSLADYPYWIVLGEKRKGPVHWEDVGQQIWTDYYRNLEDGWLHQLRRDFKVEINEEVLKTVNSH